MVFYYFGSKKSMYLYLVNLCRNIIIDKINKNLDNSVTDFFDRIKLATEIKISAIRKHPAIFSFMTSVFYETDIEVEADIKKFMAGNQSVREDFVLKQTDASKFKDGIDPALVLKFLVWASEGFASGLPIEAAIDEIDVFIKDFYKCLDFMKNNFYKEEYLS